MSEHEGGVLEEIPEADCVALLSYEQVGRIAVVHEGFPVILPVNYRLLAARSEEPVIVIRTRPGNTISRAGEHVAFEVDGIDHRTHSGWCVLVKGLLQQVDPVGSPQDIAWIDPVPWAPEGRDEWLALRPIAITGRRLRGAEPAWAFSVRGYL